MITIQTNRLEPSILANARNKSLTTEWLREGVNKLMRDNREILDADGVDTSLFYNHDPATGRTRQGYPLVIYHCINGLFYLTGINEGAFALGKLAGLYQTPFLLGGIEFSGFREEKLGSEFNLGVVGQQHTYSLIEWRPVHHTQRSAFAQLGMAAKVNELQRKLEKHLTNELGKYLKIDFKGLKLEITDITRVYEPLLYKKRHKYPAFDIRFTANGILPDMITLGNHQALGYGRVVQQ